MPFLRPGHPQPLVLSLLKSSRRSSQRRLGLLTLCSLSAPSMVHAKPFRAVGVKAWTSGSETFIRSRPSADVPPVAKVKRHTPLYVWGKYNGWYRVETHDHVFGWVFNQYIEAPKSYKVRAMPASKARLASNRTANQVMYGSPQLLKQHYAKYGAPGALKGLRKQGVRIAVAPKVKTKSLAKPRILIAKAVVNPAVAKSAIGTPSAAKRIAKTAVAKPAVRIASAPGARKTSKPAIRVAQVPSLRTLSPVPSVERIERRVRIAPVAKPVAKPVTKAPLIAREPQQRQIRALAPALSGRMNAFSAPQIEGLAQNPAPKRETAPATAPREVESDRIADSARASSSSARYFARAASQAASQAATVRETARETPRPSSGPSETPLTDSNFQPLPFKAPVSIAPVAPRVKISAPAPRKIAKKPVRKKVARSTSRTTSRSKRLALRRERDRQQLRAQMGLTPAAPHSVIAPVSPAELMRARQQYLAERKARLGVPNSPAPETPVVGLAPLPVPSGPLGGPSNNLPPTAPGGFAPMSFESSHPLAPLLGDPYVLSLAQLKPKRDLTPVTNLKPFAVTGMVSTMPRMASSRGGSPRDRMMPNRGGSPRDRFGSGMATQALSYRGMPYIRGAASPNRGFDCSGLIYYLLRQRGYNPPRTAAGYRSWGSGVSRGDLKSGDLLLFANTYKRGISHIGVYLGEGKFVHAATSATGVRVNSLNEAYYRGKYFGARRPK